jgi:hypothetical protein
MADIEDFCELGEWFDRPVRMYSSGMLARLGFAAAINMDADVMLIDEVLSVGDFAFQKKCMARIDDLVSKKRTIVFVSHNPYMVERICHRALLVDQGRVLEEGDPSKVMLDYFSLATPRQAACFAASPMPIEESRPGTGDLRILQVELLDRNQSPVTECRTGEAVTIRLHYQTRGEVQEPNVGIRILDPINTIVASVASTAARKGKNLAGRGHIDCCISALWLMPNVYTVQVKVAGDVLLDQLENATRFTVNAEPEQLQDSANMGIAFVEAEWIYSP